jgi:hypothetical protein
LIKEANVTQKPLLLFLGSSAQDASLEVVCSILQNEIFQSMIEGEFIAAGFDVTKEEGEMVKGLLSIE